jgi:signal recognition particle subunit SRP19
MAVKSPTLQDLERALKKERLSFRAEQKNHPAHWPKREGRLIVAWEGSKEELLRRVARGLDVKR